VTVTERPERTDLRDAIITASLHLGTELGEEGLTIRAIAQRLGVSATALYQHFGSKAAILQAISAYGFERLDRQLAPAFAQADPVERLRQMSLRYVAFARDNPWLYTVLFQERELQWDALDDRERANISAPLRGTLKAIADAVEAGRFRKDIDLATTPLLLWAANHGLATMILTGRISETHPAFPVESLQDFIDSFVSDLLRGFLA
jgi:AcrR family transcriptional regulator